MGKKIQIYHTHIEIHGYELGDEPEFEKLLSVWNDTKFKYEAIGFDYDEETKCLRIPRGCDPKILERMFRVEPDIIYNPDPYSDMSMRVTVEPRDDNQRQAIAFLLGEGKYSYTKKYAQLLLNLGTGAGKTYITSAAMSFFRLRTLIITHTTDIREQWLDTFFTKTDLDKHHVCIINGTASINKLFKQDIPPYKVYLTTHSTLSSYAKTAGWEGVHNLFKHLKIGLKVIDEAHLYFANMVKVDMYTNCKKNIYLTATFERSDYMEQKLFNLCTRNIVRYFDKRDNVTTRKHIVYLAVIYNSHPPLDVAASMITMRKFNKNKYASYISTCDKFYTSLKYCLDKFSHLEGKILVLSSKVESCEAIRDFIVSNYPDKTVSVFHSKISKDDKELSKEADIICSTPLSAGTGKDIPGLRIVINSECYSSQVTADQVSGRLREFNKTDYTYYIELIDRGFDATYKMYIRRRPLFTKKCVKVAQLDFDKTGF
jgi:superfamily II DNA or RNA helicase